MRVERQQGLSLVELMVAVAIAMLTVLVVMQALSVFEARKRTTTGGNDASMSAAVGLFLVERDLRMAGAGLTLPTGFACNLGVNIYFEGAAFSDGDALAPVLITDGGAGPDTVRVVRSDSGFGVAPATIVAQMASTSSVVTVNSNAQLTQQDLFLAGAPDGNKICTLMQMTQAPQVAGNAWSLSHDSGTSDFNPANPDTAFDTAIRYDIGDVIINLGRFGLRSFTVVCDDGGVPAIDNSCNLVSFNPLAAPDPLTLADVDSLTAEVVDFQAQYGVAPAGSQDVSEWVDASGATWGNPTAANIARIKAVRMAVVSRGNREPVIVSPEQLVLWDAGEATERTRDLSDEERRFRYKVLTVVVPLINVIWAGV